MEFEHLIQRLAPACREMLEQAVALASSRSHFQLDIEHLLMRMAAEPDPELGTAFTALGLSRDRLAADLQAALDELQGGYDGFPRIGDNVARLLFEAWMAATSEFDLLEIRAIHLLLALFDNSLLRSRLQQISTEFATVPADGLRTRCDQLLRANPMKGDIAPSAATPGATSPGARALERYTADLTAQARAGRIDPVLGRDAEIRQAIDILCRRRQNNPILTGEAGVGKTAVVEGLAQRIVDGDVPAALKNVSVRTLDLGLLQAGAGVRGEFENRLKGVIQEIQQSLTPVILFIDEAHTLIGAGNQAGAGDAANLLKPALARGELRTIAATTWAEYKKYIETDAALTRRFQVVKVDEPSEAQAIGMLRTLVAPLEQHHSVTILDEAVEAAVTLSHRYISGRQLPDKCVSLLDTACARVALSQLTPPAELERCSRALAATDLELTVLRREHAAGASHDSRLAVLALHRQQLSDELETLHARWREAQALLADIAALRGLPDGAGTTSPAATTTADDHATLAPAASLPPPNPSAATPSAPGPATAEAERRQQLQSARTRLQRMQSGAPMVHECVDRHVIAAVVADWTGIPVGRMQTETINQVLTLQQQLERRVIGQPHALEQIATTLLTARAGLNDPRRPQGVFLLAGPSGVGKTETALALAEQLYGSEQALTVINMSEFKEEHKVSLLMGSPPGYVGYGEGGVLTEAVRRKPYSVVLLDEIEKAHPGVQDIFYQVFDKGMLRDGEGRDIDFRHTVILLTTNAASEPIAALCADPDTLPAPAALAEAIAPALRQHFKPAFLGRLTVIPYLALDEDTLARVAKLQLAALQARVGSTYQAALVYSDRLVRHITAQCRRSDTGARQVGAIIASGIMPPLAQKILARLAEERPFGEIALDIDEHDGLTIRFAEAGQALSVA